MGMYDDYFKDFYIKYYEHWKKVFERTGNPIAKKTCNEVKELLYEKYLIELEEAPKMEKGQALLF